MADEQGGEQTAMQEDYFSSHDLIDNGDGAKEAFGEQIQEGKETEEKSVKKPETKAGEPEKKPGAKAEEKLAEKKEVPKTTGFATRFFKPDEKTGESVFDADGAHSFLTGNLEKAYDYQGKHLPPQGVEQPKLTDKPDVEPWKKPLEERKQYRQNLLNAMLYPAQVAQKRYGENVPPEIAEFYSVQIEHINSAIDEEMARYDYEQQEKREKDNWTKGETAEKQAAVKQKASANESIIAARFKSPDDYQEFMFGTKKSGKFEPGLATHAIYKLFDLANPDKAKTYGDEYNKALGQWWNEFAADQDNLEFLYEVGMSRLQKSLWGELVKKIQTTKDGNAAAKKKALTRAPGRSELSPLDEPDLDESHKALAKQLGRDTI